MNTRLQRAESYKALLTASPETTAHAFQPGLIGTMRSEVLKLERDYEAQLKVYKPDWPPMVALKGELDRSKQHLAAAVKPAVAAARRHPPSGRPPPPARAPTPPTRRRWPGAAARSPDRQAQIGDHGSELPGRRISHTGRGDQEPPRNARQASEQPIRDRRRGAPPRHQRLQCPRRRSRAVAPPTLLSVAADGRRVRPAARRRDRGRRQLPRPADPPPQRVSTHPAVVNREAAPTLRPFAESPGPSRRSPRLAMVHRWLSSRCSSCGR